jgi:hypothetical protein
MKSSYFKQKAGIANPPLCALGVTARNLAWAGAMAGMLGFAGCDSASPESQEPAGLALPGEPALGASWPDGTKKIEWYIENGDTVGLRMYHANGQVDREGALDHGQRVGVWQAFHPNGNPWARHEYQVGTQVGSYQTWHPNGKPHITGQYDANGQRTGAWTFHDSTGALVGEKRFDLPVPPDSVAQP